MACEEKVADASYRILTGGLLVRSAADEVGLHPDVRKQCACPFIPPRPGRSKLSRRPGSELSLRGPRFAASELCLREQ